MLLGFIDWDQVGNWTALTFLGVAFLFLMHWLVKHMAEEFRSLRKEHHAIQTIMMETFVLLVRHDAQIRGVNPTAGEDMTDAQIRATETYQRVLSQLENIESVITNQSKREQVK